MWTFESRSGGTIEPSPPKSTVYNSNFHLHESAEDASHFQFFCENTSRLFAAYVTEMALQVFPTFDKSIKITDLGETFWMQILPSGAMTQEPIMKAVIALGACARVSQSPDSRAANQDFISRMNSALMGITRPQTRLEPETVMMVTMVFAGCDCLLQRPRSGLIHLKSGLKIINELYSTMNQSAKSLADETLRPLLQTYVEGLAPWEAEHSSENQGAVGAGFEFTNLSNSYGGILKSAGQNLPALVPLKAKFRSVQEASSALVTISHWTSALQLLDDEVLFNALRIVSGLKSVLAQWSSSLDKLLLSAENDEDDPVTQKALLLCFAHYQMMYVIVSTFPFKDEMCYDPYGINFRVMIHKAQAYIMMDNLDPAPNRIESELNVATPLSFVISHCRIPRMRAHAVNLLKNLHKYKPTWNSGMALAIGQEIQKIEHVEAATLLGRKSVSIEKGVPFGKSESVIRYPWNITGSIRLRPFTVTVTKKIGMPTPLMVFRFTRAPYYGPNVPIEERILEIPKAASFDVSSMPNQAKSSTLQFSRSPNETCPLLDDLIACQQQSARADDDLTLEAKRRIACAKEDVDMVKADPDARDTKPPNLCPRPTSSQSSRHSPPHFTIEEHPDFRPESSIDQTRPVTSSINWVLSSTTR